MAAELILALDQGTTSSRALVTDAAGRELGLAQEPLSAVYPRSGWIEQDPEEIWTGQLAAARAAMKAAGCTASDLAGIGITNQRETTVLWDRQTGRPAARALVWQDRRSAGIVADWESAGYAEPIRRLTGLEPDAYFSASKIRWLLDHDADVRRLAADGRLAFGTVDSWLLYRLSGGAVHATDVSNASRTLLFDTERLAWSEELAGLFGVPQDILPRVLPNTAHFGTAIADHFGAEVPVLAMAGDQHAASFGQACFEPGMSKNTYGTGCFMLQNTGTVRRTPENGLLGTVAWQLDLAGGPEPAVYAVEGSVFSAGAVIQWLRDGLGIISSAAEVNALASSVPDTGDVYLVPAFTGLGAPHWDPLARGTITGLSRGTTGAHIARAALEGIALQVAEVFGAFSEETGEPLPELRVDGGAARSDLLLQLQADALGVPVVRTTRMESTVFGAAFMAGLKAGLIPDLQAISAMWEADARFEPRLNEAERHDWLARWAEAVGRARSWADA